MVRAIITIMEKIVACSMIHNYIYVTRISVKCPAITSPPMKDIRSFLVVPEVVVECKVFLVLFNLGTKILRLCLHLQCMKK